MNFRQPDVLKILLFAFIALGQCHSLVYVFTQPRITLDTVQKKASGDLLVCGRDWQKALSEKPFPTRSHEEVMSLRSDPFVPQLISVFTPRLQESAVFSGTSILSNHRHPPETPPPRVYTILFVLLFIVLFLSEDFV